MSEVRRIVNLERRRDEMEAIEADKTVYLTAPLTSTSWDGDARSTTAKTLIDLSAVFAVPAGVRAVLVHVAIRDSGSAATDCYIILSPNDTASSGAFKMTCPSVNDRFGRGGGIVPCNVDGDIYYQVVASGASTLDAYLEIWGYVF